MKYTNPPPNDLTSAPPTGQEALLPTIAVLPLSLHSSKATPCVIGEILSDEIICTLSVSPYVHIISRLSSTIFRNSETNVRQIGRMLKADYIVSGTYSGHNTVYIEVKLTNVRTTEIVWRETLQDNLDNFMSDDKNQFTTIANEILTRVANAELHYATSNPMRSIEDRSLLLSAITLMHQHSIPSSKLAHKMLQTLVYRKPHFSAPHAWLAMWHVFRVQQGWSDSTNEIHAALKCAQHALNANPNSSLAHTALGLVQTNLMRRLDLGLDSYQTALDYNPNNSLAWLLKGCLHAFKGEGTQAVKDTELARKLSPLDPLRYFYDSIAATAAVADQNYESARQLASRSLLLNGTHTSTLRSLAVSYWQLDRRAEARSVTKDLLQQEPSLTISGWLAKSPAANFPIGEEWANLLRHCGIPD